MASSKRVQVFPTRMALATWKDQEKGAAKGEPSNMVYADRAARLAGMSHIPIYKQTGAFEEPLPRFPHRRIRPAHEEA